MDKKDIMTDLLGIINLVQIAHYEDNMSALEDDLQFLVDKIAKSIEEDEFDAYVENSFDDEE